MIPPGFMEYNMYTGDYAGTKITYVFAYAAPFPSGQAVLQTSCWQMQDCPKREWEANE